MLLSSAQLCESLGITDRLLRSYRADGLRPQRGGSRPLWDAKKVQAWRRANRRSRPGEGRPRRSPRSGETAHAEAAPGPMELADLNQKDLLGLVASGRLLPGQVATYAAAVTAMGRGLALRREAGLLVEAAQVSRAITEALSAARAHIDQIPEAMVAAVGAILPLDDAQRSQVRAVARSQCDQLVDQLARVAG